MGGDRATQWPGWRDDAGNTLLLFPAALLVVLGLAAIAVDSATAYLGQRRLADLAASIANDAVAALDVDTYYRDGEIRIDLDRAHARAGVQRVLVGTDRGLEGISCTVTTSGQQATARCEGRVRPIVAPLWPTASDRLRLTATESARAAES